MCEHILLPLNHIFVEELDDMATKDQLFRFVRAKVLSPPTRFSVKSSNRTGGYHSESLRADLYSWVSENLAAS